MGMTAAMRPVTQAEIQTLLSSGVLPEAWWLGGDYGVVELYKSWDTIRAVLSTHSPAAEEAVVGGSFFGEDMGYGPPRAMLSDEVLAVAEALQEVSASDFRGRYVQTDFTDVYCQYQPEHLDELVDSYFVPMREAYLSAALTGSAMVLWMV